MTLAWAMWALVLSAEGAPIINVCVRPLGPVPERDLARTRVVAARLLGSAGITVEWQGCTPPAPPIEVILARHGAPRPHACANSTSSRVSASSAVVVYLPCLTEAAVAARGRQEARASPSIAALQLGDLIGLAIAHEIGHVLGLRHAPAGVMRARLDLGDLAALGQGRLVFRGSDGVRMRVAMRQRDAAVTARHRR